MKMQTTVILVAVLVNIFLVLETSVVARVTKPNEQVALPQPVESGKSIWCPSGILKWITKSPKVEKTETKYERFRKELRKTSKCFPFTIEVTREKILFATSYLEIKYASKNRLLASRLIVTFEKERGAGRGLVKEWFSLITQEIVNPSRGLFQYIDEYATDVQNNFNYFPRLIKEFNFYDFIRENFHLRINPRSKENYGDDPYTYFKFAGRVFGLAVFHNMRVKASFIKPFYLTILGKKVELKHVEIFDPMYYQSLMMIKENPDEMDHTFSVEEIISNDETVMRDLKENGDNILVTEDNVDEYIDLLIQWNYVLSVQKQMSAFLEGFHTLIPSSLLETFDENELEVIMCSDDMSIDIEDWKNNTLYVGYKEDSEIISWFWNIVGEFDNEKKWKLLQFFTGMLTLPIGGFKELKQKFKIKKNGNLNEVVGLGASSCDYTLYLPPYESYQQLKNDLNYLVGNKSSNKFTKF